MVIKVYNMGMKEAYICEYFYILINNKEIITNGSFRVGGKRLTHSFLGAYVR